MVYWAGTGQIRWDRPARVDDGVSCPIEVPEAGSSPRGLTAQRFGPVFISFIPNPVEVKTFAMRTWLFVGLAGLVGIGIGIGLAIARVNQYPWDGTPLGAASDAAEALARGSGGPVPKILLEEETYDFGVMDSNSKGRHEFVFTNIGEGLLQLKKGPTSCSCAATVLQEGTIAPRESGIVAVEWTAKTSTREFTQTAEIHTNDPNRERVTLTITGRVTIAVEASPRQLIFAGVTAGEASSGSLRVFGFLPRPRSLEITGHEFSKPDLADYFEVTYRPLSADELAAEEDEDLTSGCLVEVTVKPGLPVGAFRQTITLKTNYPESPAIELPVQGNVGGEIAIVGKGWNQRAGVLSLGSIRSREGAKRQLFIRAGGPDSKDVTYKPVETYPDLLRVTLGKTTQIEGGEVSLTPLIIEIPRGSRPANHMGLDEEQLGRIILETTHPQARQLRMLVRFAVEG